MLRAVWGCGTFNVFGEQYFLNLGVELLDIKALLKLKIGALRATFVFQKNKKIYIKFNNFIISFELYEEIDVF